MAHRTQHSDHESSEVALDDWLCRFVRPGEWDDNNRPLPVAFKASDHELSLFHIERVRSKHSDLEGLCIGSLAGAGQAHVTRRICVDAALDISPQFKPEVYWRPDKVGQDWEPWSDAHVQVESDGGNDSFPITYRLRLSERATPVKPPQGS